MKHTPGPWHVDDKETIRSEDGKIITALHCDIKLSLNESLANAKLMAGAPNLLSACLMAKEELVFGGDWKNAIRIIEKAINKATE